MPANHDRLLSIRRALASVLALVTLPAAGASWPSGSDAALEWLLVLAPVAAAALMWVPRFEAQLVSRSVMWAGLFWTTFISVVLDSSGPDGLRVVLGGGLCAAAALVLLPVSDLDAPAWTRAFRPTAFRAIIATVLVLALADAMVLSLGFGISINEMPGHSAPHIGREDLERALFFGSAALAMGVAIVGLLRLRGWAFALNLAANVSIAGMAWALSAVRWPLALALSSTAALQLLVAFPLARRIARTDASDPSDTLKRAWPYAIGVVVLVLLGGRVYHAFV